MPSVLSLTNNSYKFHMPPKHAQLSSPTSLKQNPGSNVRVNIFSCIWGTLVLLSVRCQARVPPHGDFVNTHGSQFILNGSPFLFNGFNSYWMMNVATEPSERYKVSNVFRDASAAGLTVCRTWAFSDGGDKSLQITPGVYDDRVFQGLDFVLAEAQKYGVHLILSFVNNYKDYGGRPQYIQWARNDGVQVNNDDDFYTNSVVKDYYKNHIKKLLTRLNTITNITYKDDSIIMAWELINEPRSEVDSTGNSFNVWIQEMAIYTKSIDNKHLLEIGLEGFYGDSVPDRKQFNPGYQIGTDFITNNKIKEIDFTTVHAYPDIWLADHNDTDQLAFMQRWMSSHWSDSMKVIKKPLIFSEFGKSNKDPGYTLGIRDSYITTVYESMYNFARQGAVGGGLIWQIMAEGMDLFYDGYEIVLSQESTTSSVIASYSKKMNVLGSMMKKTIKG